MSRQRAPGLAREQAYRVAVHLLGSGDLRVILAVVMLLVGIGWFTDALLDLLQDLDSVARGIRVDEWWPLHRRIALGFFGIEMLLLWGLARGVRRRYRPRIDTDDDPAQARGLVLFLSNLKLEPKDEVAALRAALPELSDIDAFRRHPATGSTPWRMPVEALAYHLPRLRRVVAICSPESHAQWGLFRELVSQLFPNAGILVTELSEFDGGSQDGLSFNDMPKVAQATDDALGQLMEQGLALSDILIDITGGLKLNAVAATAVALAEGRRIEYVSGKGSEPYQVSVYDVTYER